MLLDYVFRFLSLNVCCFCCCCSYFGRGLLSFLKRSMQVVEVSLELNINHISYSHMVNKTKHEDF